MPCDESGAKEQRMPLTYRIDTEHHVVMATATGILSIDDLFEYQRDAWAQNEVRGFDELVDMRNVDLVNPPPTAHLRGFTEFAASMDESIGESRLAIVAKGDLDFGLARMFQAFRELNPKSKKIVQVFRSLSDALAFLGLSDADYPGENS